jgi:hypothetical protein
MTGLVALGVDVHEPETGMVLVAILVFLALFLWAFASPRVARVWWTLAALCCLEADQPSMAVLVWLMLLALSAALVAIVLGAWPAALRLAIPPCFRLQ